MLVHRRVTPSSKFASTHLYSWVERGTVRVKYLAQEHNTMTRPGLEPGPSDPESSALTIRPPRHPHMYIVLFINCLHNFNFLVAFFSFPYAMVRSPLQRRTRENHVSGLSYLNVEPVTDVLLYLLHNLEYLLVCLFLYVSLVFFFCI